MVTGYQVLEAIAEGVVATMADHFRSLTCQCFKHETVYKAMGVCSIAVRVDGARPLQAAHRPRWPEVADKDDLGVQSFCVRDDEVWVSILAPALVVGIAPSSATLPGVAS